MIQKLKEQNSQKLVPIKKAKVDPVEEEEEVDEQEEEEEEVEETPVAKKKIVSKKKDPETDPSELADEINSLHDNGIYRLQKLSVLHQINNNLKIIAGVLVDLSGIK